MSIEQVQTLQHVEQQAQAYYHSRWSQLQQEARLEYSRARSSQLDEVGLFETSLGAARLGVIQLQLDQARREHHLQSSSLRNELTAAQSNAVTPRNRDRVHQELQELRASRVHP
eukprot:4706973-Amphidinium_carterae.1